MKGYVYIISNKAMPGLFKVGYTDRDPQVRAKELNSTGIPHPFVVEYEILLDNPYNVEQGAHFKLKKYNENKEWFRCNFELCVYAIRECCSGNIYYEKCYKKGNEAEFTRYEEELRRKKMEEKAAEENLKRQKEIKEQEENIENKWLEEYYETVSEYRRNYTIAFATACFLFFMSLDKKDLGGFIFLSSVLTLFFYMIFSLKIAEWHAKDLKKTLLLKAEKEKNQLRSKNKHPAQHTHKGNSPKNISYTSTQNQVQEQSGEYVNNSGPIEQSVSTFIIKCPECNKYLRLKKSNAECLRVHCPRCDIKFYWNNRYRE